MVSDSITGDRKDWIRYDNQEKKIKRLDFEHTYTNAFYTLIELLSYFSRNCLKRPKRPLSMSQRKRLSIIISIVLGSRLDVKGIREVNQLLESGIELIIIVFLVNSHKNLIFFFTL